MPNVVKSLVLGSLSWYSAHAIDIDVNNADSVRSVAKTLITGIFAGYKGGSLDLAEEYRGRFDAGRPFDNDSILRQTPVGWNTIIDYGFLTGDNKFVKDTQLALVSQAGPQRNFVPRNMEAGNISTGLWALAAISAEDAKIERGENFPSWFDIAKGIFHTKAQDWDGENQVCGGGLNSSLPSAIFKPNINVKDAKSTGGFFLLAARLALATGEKRYADFADRIYKWTEDQTMIRPDGTVYFAVEVIDGVCKNTDPTYENREIQSHGMYAEGAALMYNFTKGGDDNWKRRVDLLVKGTDFYWNETRKPVEFEVTLCPPGIEGCIDDFEGERASAVRSWARTSHYASFVSSKIKTKLQQIATSEAKACKREGSSLICGRVQIAGRSDYVEKTTGEGYLTGPLSALSAVQALLYEDSFRKSGNSKKNAAPTLGAAWSSIFIGISVAVLGVFV